MRYLSAGQVCRLTNLPGPTLESLVREGGITPVQAGNGPGNHRRFSAAQSLAISLSRWLRKEKGWSLRGAGNVLETLLRYTDEQLEAAFAEGRTRLFVVNDLPMPWLTTADAAESNPEIFRLQREAAAAGVPCRVESLDIERAWRKLVREIDKSSNSKAKVRR